MKILALLAALFVTQLTFMEPAASIYDILSRTSTVGTSLKK
jgi:hypothetical protein